MHEVLVNRLGGLSLPRKSVLRLTDHPDMTLDVYRGCKTTMQQKANQIWGTLKGKNFLPIFILYFNGANCVTSKEQILSFKSSPQ